MWRYLIPAGLFGALVVFFFVGLGRDKETLPSPLIGKPAPAFTLSTLEDPDKQVSVANFKGRKFVLNVWGTWCTGCRQEHDVLMTIARQNLVPILGLNWKDDRNAAREWLQRLGNPYVATAFDPEGRAGIDWGVYGAPETFLIDEHGTVLYKHIAPLTLDIWNRDFVPRITGELAGAGR